MRGWTFLYARSINFYTMQYTNYLIQSYQEDGERKFEHILVEGGCNASSLICCHLGSATNWNGAK